MTKKCLPLDGDDDELALQSAGFTALRRGLRPTAAELAFPARLDVGRAEAAAARLLARETLLVADDGRIEGIAGLTLRPTRHLLTHDGTSIHTWCAFDSVGIPAAMGVDATATTDCGRCGTPIEVEIRAGEVGATDVWGWMPALDPDETALITNFCSNANLFCDQAHLDAWRESAGRPAGDPCTLDEFLEMGRATWEHCVV